MHITRMASAVVASAVLVGGLSACGTHASSPAAAAAPATSGTPSGGQSPIEATPAALLQKIGETTSAAKSAKIEETITTSTGTTTASGVLSWQNGVQGDLQTQIPAAQASKVGSDGSVEVRYLPDAMYVNMHMADKFSQALGGKHWFEYDYANLDQTPGSTGAAFKDSLKNADPVALVRLLIASGRVTKVGTDTVNGHQATHYSGDLTPGDLTAGNGVTSDQLAVMRELLQARKVTSGHIDLWVDGDNLVVKREEKLTTATGLLETTVTYSEYGVQVQPTPPPEDDSFKVAKQPLSTNQPSLS